MASGSAVKEIQPWSLGIRFRTFYLVLLVVMLICMVIAAVMQFWPYKIPDHHDDRQDYLKISLENAEEVRNK